MTEIDKRFYLLATHVGQAKTAAAWAAGETIRVNKAVLGDADGDPYDPTPEQTRLVSPVWEGPAATTANPDDPASVLIHFTVPASEGGFFIRELGIYDEDDDLLAVARVPVTEKPSYVKDIVVQAVLKINNAETIDLTHNLDLVHVSLHEFEKAKAQLEQDLAAHAADADLHLRAGERERWQAGAETADAALAATGVAQQTAEAAQESADAAAQKAEQAQETAEAAQAGLASHAANAEIHVTPDDKARWDSGGTGGGQAAAANSWRVFIADPLDLDYIGAMGKQMAREGDYVPGMQIFELVNIQCKCNSQKDEKE